MNDADGRAAEAAKVASALSDGMNLLFLFAAPRVLESVRASGDFDEAAMLASLRRFLGVSAQIRNKPPGPSSAGASDIDRLAKLSAIVETIAGELGARTGAASAMSTSVVERAREALEILGMPPPRGGWDAFDGFTLPTPGTR